MAPPCLAPELRAPGSNPGGASRRSRTAPHRGSPPAAVSPAALSPPPHCWRPGIPQGPGGSRDVQPAAPAARRERSQPFITISNLLFPVALIHWLMLMMTITLHKISLPSSFCPTTTPPTAPHERGSGPCSPRPLLSPPSAQQSRAEPLLSSKSNKYGIGQLATASSGNASLQWHRVGPHMSHVQHRNL